MGVLGGDAVVQPPLPGRLVQRQDDIAHFGSRIARCPWSAQHLKNRYPPLISIKHGKSFSTRPAYPSTSSSTLKSLTKCEAKHGPLREALLPPDVPVALELSPEIAMQRPVDLVQQRPVRGIDADVQPRDMLQRGKLITRD